MWTPRWGAVPLTLMKRLAEVVSSEYSYPGSSLLFSDGRERSWDEYGVYTIIFSSLVPRGLDQGFVIESSKRVTF